MAIEDLRKDHAPFTIFFSLSVKYGSRGSVMFSSRFFLFTMRRMIAG